MDMNKRAVSQLPAEEKPVTAPATSWWASDAIAAFGMQIATGAVCSKESGIEKSRTFTALLRGTATSDPPPQEPTAAAPS